MGGRSYKRLCAIVKTSRTESGNPALSILAGRGLWVLGAEVPCQVGRNPGDCGVGKDLDQDFHLTDKETEGPQRC